MDPNDLREQLTKLHEELSAARRVDPGSNQLLGELMDDIKRLMQQPADGPASDASNASRSAASPPSAPAAAAPSLPGRLEKIAVQFEADHPTLAASSRRLVDLLGKAGL